LGVYGPFEEMSDADFRMQMETNFQGALRITRAFLPAMRQAGRGKILNVSSILGQLAIPTGSAYSASKWAMEGWSEALRYELAPAGIRVTLIEPGLIQKNFKKNMVIGRAPENSPYSHLHRQMGRDYKRMATSAEFCARRIARIMLKDRPRLRYRIGIDAHMAHALKRSLPQFLMDFIVRKASGK
jgi:short-subunit dehydrogenase